MSNPEDPKARAAALFRAAKQDRPSPDTRERLVEAMLRELDNPAAEALGDEPAETRDPAARRTWRWLAVAALVGALALFVSRSRRDPSVAILPVSSAKHAHGNETAVPPSPTEMASVPPAPSPVRDAAVPEKSVLRRGTPRPVRETRPEPSAEPPRPAPSLVEEVTALDRARSALAQGDTAGALQSLDDYDQVLHGVRLREEATLLRIELLAKSGHTAEARAMAARFVADNPGSSLAERARRFLERQVGNRVDAGGLP